MSLINCIFLKSWFDPSRRIKETHLFKANEIKYVFNDQNIQKYPKNIRNNFYEFKSVNKLYRIIIICILYIFQMTTKP